MLLSVPGSESVVHVADLRKTFKVPEREAGLRAAARSLVRRTTKDPEDAVRAPVSDGRRGVRPGTRALSPGAGLPPPDHPGHGQSQPAPVGHPRPGLLRAVRR